MKVIALIEAPGHASARYRLEPFFARAREEGWRCGSEPVHRAWRERRELFRRAADADLVILQRRLLGWAGRRLLRGLAGRVPLAYDVDDALWLPDSFAGRARSRTREFRWKATLELCAGVIAGNDYLADKAGQDCARVETIPTCVSPPLPRADERPGTTAGPRASAGPVAAWIGSSATLGYLESAADALHIVAARVPGFRLRVIADRAPRFEGLAVEHRPWSEATEWRDLAGCRLGLAPLLDDPWTRGKCGLKVLQYAAAGLPCVASRTGVQAEQVVDGVSGRLAPPDDMEAFSAAMIELLGDPGRAAAFGRAARASLDERWSHAAWYPRWKRAIEGLAASR